MKREHAEPEAVRIEAGAWRRVLKWEEEPVLTISLRWPKLDETLPGPRRVGRYYRQVEEQWKTRWEGELYRRACAAAAAAREASRPFQPWTASLDFALTRLDGALLSLYQDAVEDTGDRRPTTVRRGDTWAMPSGTPRSLASFFPAKGRWKRRVLDEIAAQAERRAASGESLFYQDWRERLEGAFHPERFYLTETGIAVFYPLYTIAPFAEGIPVFSIAGAEGAEQR